MTAWSAIAGSKPIYPADTSKLLRCPQLSSPCTHRPSLHFLTAGDILSGMDQIKSPTRYVC